jgi:acyl-coenzyme A thioesterase 9
MGGIQIGKLLEDLDALAGNVAMKHCDDSNENTTPVNLVTASVDRIIQSHPLTMQSDYALVCQMAYVGRSSLDIIIRMHRVEDIQAAVSGNPAALGPCVLTSVFTFAARDYSTGKPKQVNRLVPETPDEIDLYKQREALAIQRKNSKKQGMRIDKELLTPLVERGAAVVDMPALAHPNAVLMSQTRLENCFICEPQKVNFYGIIFGGYLST